MCSFANLGGGEDYVVVVEVETEGMLSSSQTGKRSWTDQETSSFSRTRRRLILIRVLVVCTESVECCCFVSEGASHVQNHYCISILLLWEFEQ
jgi:hypothetical protein